MSGRQVSPAAALVVVEQYMELRTRGAARAVELNGAGRGAVAGEPWLWCWMAEVGAALCQVTGHTVRGCRVEDLLVWKVASLRAEGAYRDAARLKRRRAWDGEIALVAEELRMRGVRPLRVRCAVTLEPARRRAAATVRSVRKATASRVGRPIGLVQLAVCCGDGRYVVEWVQRSSCDARLVEVWSFGSRDAALAHVAARRG